MVRSRDAYTASIALFFIPPIPPISPLRAEHPLERVTRIASHLLFYLVFSRLTSPTPSSPSAYGGVFGDLFIFDAFLGRAFDLRSGSDARRRLLGEGYRGMLFE